MKKLISSLAIFILIIVFGILSLKLYNNTSNKLSQMVDSTTNFVEQNDWDKAKSQIESIQEKWDVIESIWALLIDHTEMDNIEMSLQKSKKYIETKDLALSLAELENLRFMIEHIYQKEMVNFKNIF